MVLRIILKEHHKFSSQCDSGQDSDDRLTLNEAHKATPGVETIAQLTPLAQLAFSISVNKPSSGKLLLSTMLMSSSQR